MSLFSLQSYSLTKKDKNALRRKPTADKMPLLLTRLARSISVAPHSAGNKRSNLARVGALKWTLLIDHPMQKMED